MQVDAIVFLVDALDRERFQESKRELDGLLADEALAKVLSPPFMLAKWSVNQTQRVYARDCAQAEIQPLI